MIIFRGTITDQVMINFNQVVIGTGEELLTIRPIKKVKQTLIKLVILFMYQIHLLPEVCRADFTSVCRTAGIWQNDLFPK